MYGRSVAFKLVKGQKSEGAKSGEYGGWQITVNPLRFRQDFTNSATCGFASS